MFKLNQKIWFPATLVVTLGLTLSCTGANFSSAAANKAKAKSGTQPGGPGKGNKDPDLYDTDTGLSKGKLNPDYDNDINGQPGGDGSTGTPIRIFDGKVPVVLAVKPIKPEQNPFIWGVTTDGAVTHLDLAGEKVTAVKKWTGAVGGGGGSRTYVIEGGNLIVSRTGGSLYFIDKEKTPQGPLGGFLYKLNGPAAGDRVCVVSYKRDGARYLGMAWGKGNFSETPQDNTPPYAPQWANTVVNAGNAGPEQWGYSCFVDQVRLIMYSQWVSAAATGMQAIDLNTKKGLDPKEAAPNGKFASNNLGTATLGASARDSKGAYAMSGDHNGNVFNGSGFYTYGYESQSGTVWADGYNGGVTIFPAACLANQADCAGHAAFNTEAVGFKPGPVSALGNGYMVGMVRGSGDVIMMKLNDPADISKGITAVKVYNLGGDPYMYTDYTGATLYITHSEQSYAFSNLPAYDATKPFKAIGFAWAPRDAAKNTFVDIDLHIRCYKAADPNKPEYEKVSEPIDVALKQTVLSKIKSCTGTMFDTVDVKMDQLNDGTSLMNIRKVQVTGYQ